MRKVKREEDEEVNGQGEDGCPAPHGAFIVTQEPV